jgi:hypothetical protein
LCNKQEEKEEEIKRNLGVHFEKNIEKLAEGNTK